MPACALQGKGTKLRDIPNGTLPACPRECLLLAVMHVHFNTFTRSCDTRAPNEAVRPRFTAVHFKLSKIPGREELMELLHDVLYKRKGQVEEWPGVLAEGLQSFPLLRWCDEHHV